MALQGYGQLQHCPMLGLLSVSHDPFGVERRKEGIHLPQTTSAAEHLRSNLLEERFLIAHLKHKLTLLYHQKE